MKEIGPFDFGKPVNDKVERIQREIMLLENGAKYEGEW